MMSESEQRRRLKGLMSHETNRPDLQTFLEGLAASDLPLAEQLGRVLDLDDIGQIMPGPYVTAMLKVHELAPTMIRYFNKTDEYFQDLLVQLIGHLDHEDVVPFFLSLLKKKRDSYFRSTVVGALERYPWHEDMLPSLLEAIQNTEKDSNLRQKAIRMIASQPDKKTACTLLLPLLRDSDSDIRFLTLVLIKDLGDMSLAHHVEPFLFDSTLVGSSTVGNIARLILDTWATKSK
jgi:hypothetical protein